MIYKYYKRIVLALFCSFILGAAGVHLFDSEFAGVFTREDLSKQISQGEQLYKKKGCYSCHGANGNSPVDESYPLIGGQPRVYLERQIKDIRDGERSNGSASLMKSSIQRVKDNDVYLISLYLSVQ